MIDVPVRLVPDDDDPQLFLPYVSIEVDGVSTEALLDSGAPRTQVVDRPGLVIGDEVSPESAGAFGSRDRGRPTTEVSCRLGGRNVGTVVATVVPANRSGRGALVGQDVLARFRCEYRLADALLVLNPERLPPGDHGVVLGMRQHVYLDAGWNEATIGGSGVFDTGASITVVDRGFADRHSELFRLGGTRSGTDATGQTADVPIAVMKGPRLLGVEFADALVALVDLSAANKDLDRRMDLILGWTVIGQANWIIDHATGRAACELRSGR
jgi:hypothetical protein